MSNCTSLVPSKNLTVVYKKSEELKYQKILIEERHLPAYSKVIKNNIDKYWDITNLCEIKLLL